MSNVDYQQGYPVVIVPREMLEKYAHQLFADVLDAARAGTDGLKADIDGAIVPPDHAALREIRQPGLLAHGKSSLLRQNW